MWYRVVMTDSERRPYKLPIGAWDALNDVEVAADGNMYWAVLERFEPDAAGREIRSITQYDLTHEVAWAVVRSHNEAMGLVEDARGLWYRPEEGIYWRDTVPEDYTKNPSYCGNGGTWHPNAVNVGECSSGCCDDYECPDCGKTWRYEWPD